MPYFAISMEDGSVGVMQTIGDVAPEECVRKWPDTERAKVRTIVKVDPAKVPTDRTYRNAWTLAGKGIQHDMDKARAIHRGRLRGERAPLLAALDVEFMRVIEKPDTKRTHLDVAADKQKLRDVTAHPAIDAAKTVADLAALTLDALTK